MTKTEEISIPKLTLITNSLNKYQMK